MRFEGRTAIVTGAASGIGFATLRAFASEGANVIGLDLNESAFDATREKLGALAARVQLRAADVASTSACRDAIASIVAERGRIDVLCNIAGFAAIEHFTSVSEDDFDRMFGVNVRGLFFLTQAALPHLLASKGNVVNMASVAGLVGNPYNSTYCATKGAVVSLTRALAAEYGKRGVRFNCVCPGSVITEATRRTKIPEGTDRELFALMTPPLGHCAPEDIASAVLYLASDDARYVTGTAFSIDGGRSAV